MDMDKTLLKPSLGIAVAVAIACTPAVTGADVPAVPLDKVRAAAPMSPVILANEILNRWELVAVAAGVHTSAWREMFATQLYRMDTAMLRGMDRVKADAASDARANYAQFESAFKGALMQSYAAGQRGKGDMKLGSATVDQVFIPITPCRVVDSRNLLGPILAGLARNYQFYASATGVDFGASQGGLAGAAGTVCPGTVNPNGGAPSAAVVTVTVVGPTAAGNFIMWGGASPTPLASVLNWNNPGDIAANTTVVPAGGRTGNGPGGAIQDFAVAYNGPSGQAQVVVDVVGYLVENRATALECVYLSAAGTGTNNIPNTGQYFIGAPNCTTGYTRTSIGCYFFSYPAPVLIELSPGLDRACYWTNLTGAAYSGSNLTAETVCCRVPGR